ncbi:thioredoxin family protein [Planctomycetes bacterium K23_9]|uniref:Thiol:disulfide interchange protein n=1 Tax=Stieleria marina TaxID=1930275 RepID=A0A517NQ85_9BACT|nr:thiol:disulfide interchange protein precursor [Planctomycetes bacterium K23_9]
MRTVAQFPAVLALVALVATTASVAQGQIAWQTNLQAAHAQAKTEGKLLLLHFYSDNCVFCDRLEAGSFKSPQVGEAISRQFVPVKIHGGNNTHLTSMFKVTKYPTDVVVRADGTTLSHTVSPQDPARFVAMLNGAMQASKVNVAAKPGASQVSAATPPASSSIQMPVQVKSNHVGDGPQVNQFASAKAGTKSPESAATEGIKVPAKTVSAKMPSNESIAKAKSSSATPQLAMQGYCPVTVIKKDEWVEGNPKMGVVHLGKLYLFANADAMETFLADPVPYTPVLNEIDVVRYFEERRIVPGKREWGLKDPTHNRMFFFADEAAMNHFWNEYERYTAPAIKVMEKAVKDANPGT